MTKLCVKFVCVCEIIVCERWYVTKLGVKFVLVKLLCVCECVEAGGGGGEATRDTESKTRTPHKVVGNYGNTMLMGQDFKVLCGSYVTCQSTMHG